jgi:hypothetical protein
MEPNGILDIIKLRLDKDAQNPNIEMGVGFTTAAQKGVPKHILIEDLLDPLTTTTVNYDSRERWGIYVCRSDVRIY